MHARPAYQRPRQAKHELAPLTLSKTHDIVLINQQPRQQLAAWTGQLCRSEATSSRVQDITITAAVPNHVTDVSSRRAGNVSRDPKPDHTLHNKDSSVLNPRISNRIGIARNWALHRALWSNSAGGFHVQDAATSAFRSARRFHIGQPCAAHIVVWSLLLIRSSASQFDRHIIERTGVNVETGWEYIISCYKENQSRRGWPRRTSVCCFPPSRVSYCRKRTFHVLHSRMSSAGIPLRPGDHERLMRYGANRAHTSRKWLPAPVLGTIIRRHGLPLHWFCFTSTVNTVVLRCQTRPWE